MSLFLVLGRSTQRKLEWWGRFDVLGRCWPVLGGIYFGICLCFCLQGACSLLLSNSVLHLPTHISVLLPHPSPANQWSYLQAILPCLVGLGGVRKTTFEKDSPGNSHRTIYFLNVKLEAIKNVNFLLRTSITLGNLF